MSGVYRMSGKQDAFGRATSAGRAGRFNPDVWADQSLAMASTSRAFNSSLLSAASALGALCSTRSGGDPFAYRHRRTSSAPAVPSSNLCRRAAR